VKSKILFRLIMYFVSTFVIFGLIIGTIFAFSFSRHNINLHRAELESRAENAAAALAGILDDTARRYGMRQGRLGIYLSFIEDITMSDAWIVDGNLDLLTFGRRHANLSHSDLPYGAEEIITEALKGTTSVSERFSAFLGTPTITAATPIILPDGEITGALLLHTFVSDIEATTAAGFTILVYSTLVAVAVSIFVAVALSSRFTNPLGKIKRAALKISGGDYSAKTDVKQHDEIGKLAAVLDDMAHRLYLSSKESEKLEKLRRDFVANISHELRTPITVIRGSLEALCDKVVSDSEMVDEYNSQMLSETIYLERLVNDLLDLSRLQNTDFNIEMQELDLKSIAEDVMRSMMRIAEQKGITFVFECNGENFASVGDYGRLRQMFIIILDNAIKFSPNGNIVKIILAKNSSTIDLSIRDEGEGIHPDDLPLLFDRFFRQCSEQNKTGTGLGLAIAKQIASRHRADIEVTSIQGKGSEFRLAFPCDNTERPCEKHGFNTNLLYPD